MSFKTGIAAFGCLFFFSCEDSNRDVAPKETHVITGQVFVIQKNRVNVKLGGVDVYYIPMAEFRERCSWISSERSRAVEVNRYREKIEQIEDWLSDIERSDSASKFDLFLTNASRLQETALTRFKSNPEIVEFLKIEDLRVANKELFSRSDVSDNESSQWIATCLYFDWMHRNADRKVQTNADGNFSITIPKSAPGVIMMNSSRQLFGGDFENFYWLKEIEGNEVDPLIFSSSDTVTGGFLMKVVRQAAEPKRSSQALLQSEFDLIDLEWFSAAQPIFTSISTYDDQIASLQGEIRKLEETIQDIRYRSEQ